MPDAAIEAEVARRAPVHVETIEFQADDDGRAVALFDALQTQWKWTGAGMAGAFRTGLDYAAIEPVARLRAIAVDAQVMDDLQEIEAEALKTWSARG